jgi:hypothetical protein
LLAFDKKSDDRVGEPAQAARQLDGLGEAERMGRSGCKGNGERVLGKIETVDPARLGHWRHRINENDR